MAILLIVSSTAIAQTIEPTRPIKQYEFPLAKEYLIDGIPHKCFEKDGKGWKNIGHIVVDYRAFFPWANWADAQIDQINTIKEQGSIWRTIAERADHAHRVTSSAYAEEHKLRLSLQRDRKLVPWLLGGGLAIETILIVGLSIWGAAQ